METSLKMKKKLIVCKCLYNAFCKMVASVFNFRQWPEAYLILHTMLFCPIFYEFV